MTPHHEIDGWIKTALNGSKEWVLIGGPPCQAYSLAGRSRMRPSDSEKFEKDIRSCALIFGTVVKKQLGLLVSVNSH